LGTAAQETHSSLFPVPELKQPLEKNHSPFLDSRFQAESFSAASNPWASLCLSRFFCGDWRHRQRSAKAGISNTSLRGGSHTLLLWGHLEIQDSMQEKEERVRKTTFRTHVLLLPLWALSQELYRNNSYISPSAWKILFNLKGDQEPLG
jgi:hypothetical protein